MIIYSCIFGYTCPTFLSLVGTVRSNLRTSGMRNWDEDHPSTRVIPIFVQGLKDCRHRDSR